MQYPEICSAFPTVINEEHFQDGKIKYTLSDGRVIWDMLSNLRQSQTTDGPNQYGCQKKELTI